MTNNNIKKWYAVYAKSRSEKKVFNELEFQGIEAYLPLQRKLRQWSDRKKWVEMPLIPGYIFVYISKLNHEKVIQTQGVVAFVSFEGKPAIIPANQIETIKHLLRQQEIEVKLEQTAFISGDKVEVSAGPLIGLKGELISVKGKKRVAVQLEKLNLTLTVELPLNEIIKIKH